VNRMKILVVDDDQIVLDSCKRILESEGHSVSRVASADNALEVIERNDFDLMLIDIKMPIHDGIYLMGEVKRRRPDATMIAMSGYYTAETIAAGEKMGAAAFLAKPFTPDELVQAVSRVMQKDGRHETDKSPGH
jgi:DNA-binding NtrC family response regulator